jgi:hypothetical protein
MPNRMLRDWTDSLKLDGISADVGMHLVLESS